jgi:nickel-dependent lactate racemase
MIGTSHALLSVSLPYGEASLDCRLPEDRVAEVVRPLPISIPVNPKRLIDEALSAPIGCSPLETMAEPGRRVAIVIDDISRSTPTRLILPAVIDRLLSAGIEAESIRIVIALGSHRPLSREEILSKTGSEIFQAFRIVNVPCWEEDAMVSLGETADGIPAEVNRHVVEADLRIGIGSIFPHMDAGYGGGAKIILPGVCSCRTVNAFHARSASTAVNQLGSPDAPSRRTLEAFVQEKVGLDFIFNVIPGPDGGVYRCVAGHAVAAHRRGVAIARDVYAVPVRKRCPLVIVNSYPTEMDFWQCTKAFWTADLMTTDGGMAVLLSPCPEGTGGHPLWAEYLEEGPSALQRHLESGDAEDPCACAFAILLGHIRKRIRLGAIIPTIPDHAIERMGIVPFESIDQALAVDSSSTKLQDVAVITHGGSTIPMPPPSEDRNDF